VEKGENSSSDPSHSKESASGSSVKASDTTSEAEKEEQIKTDPGVPQGKKRCVSRKGAVVQ